MSHKKSYMSKINILSESFFDKILKLIGLDQVKALKKDKTFKTDLKSLNKSIKNLEKDFKKSYGEKLNLNKFSLKDFI